MKRRNPALIVRKIPLTAREAELYTYLTQLDASNKEIAHRMGITPATMRVYRLKLFRKLGAKNGRVSLLLADR